MHQDQSPGQEPTAARPSSPVRNPYILNFCRVLAEKKGERLEPEAMKRLLEDMYRLYEYMLGQNMIESLPELQKQEYLELTKDLSKLTYEKIGEVFDKNIPEYERIMKETMKQFADIYLKNRQFSTKDYPVPEDVLTDGE
ncbi:MAG: Zn-dependent oligopeptidase [Syntrophobacteraceae bacterium]|nr:Zn-dependent oligopeptidase [Syntrophobacteraceae bacterium]